MSLVCYIYILYIHPHIHNPIIIIILLGKLVLKLFEYITDIASDPKFFVSILIDEVESLVSSRVNNNEQNEPQDSVRAVNAVLTSLDQLKRNSNVLVLCTSNMIHGIDQVCLYMMGVCMGVCVYVFMLLL